MGRRRNNAEWGSLLLWLLSAIAAAIAGRWIGSTRMENNAWPLDLFSEYDPPRPLYLHLLQSKRTSPLMNFSSLWNPPAANGWRPCVNNFNFPSVTTLDRSRYFQVLCGGGLFQLHICVSNAVAVARLLNATLVIPYFKQHPFWNDPSQFEDIYDMKHFISSLKGNIKVVKELPAMLSWSNPEYYWNRCLERPNCLTFLPKHTTVNWFYTHLVPIFESYSIAVVDGFEHKLTFEGLPEKISKLRCKANFYALRFIKPIRELGNTLALRMRTKSTSTLADMANRTTLHYIGLHVRFERDMIAHSSCDYGGGRAEQKSLASFRYHMWSNRVAKAQRKPEDIRKNGSCPLTPEEMGLLLSALGFTRDTPIYIAAKEVYGGYSRIKPLKESFPHIESKYTLATREELSSFRRFSHKLTAVDFTVLFNSDVFMSNSAGNFPNVLTGYRTLFGPRTSIHPDKAYLSSLFSNKSMDWKTFSGNAVAAHHGIRMGEIQKRAFRYSVFRYPAPDCMCQTQQD